MKRCHIEMVDLLHPATDFCSKEEEHPIVCEYRPVPKISALNNAKLDFVGEEEVEGGSPKSRAEKAARRNRVVQSRTKSLTYRGNRVEKREAIDKYVVFRNRRTNAVHIVETELMYTMRPLAGSANDADEESSVNSSDDEDNPDVMVDDGPGDPRTVAEQREELLRLFGGHKSVKTFDDKRRERNQEIRTDVANEHATRAIERAAANLAEAPTPGDGTSRHLAPPHNPRATEPAECYPLQGLISPAEMDAIEAEAKSIRKMMEEEDEFQRPERWSEVAFEYMMKVVAQEQLEESLKLTRTCACVYLNYLIVLKLSPPRLTIATRLQLESHLQIGETAARHLFERFYDKSGKDLVRSQGCTDRIIYYIAVMWFTIGGFDQCRGIGRLGGALDISSKDMAKYIKRVGGMLLKAPDTPAGDYGNFLAELKAPLKFPIIDGRRKSKSKSKKRRRK